MAAADATERLLRVLDAEEKLYVELRSVLQEEQRHMANLDPAGVEKTVRAKEALAAEARLLEEGRLEVAAVLAGELGLDTTSPTLSGLCERLGDDGEALSEAHSRLSALVGAVRELLAINAAFAGDALAQVRATLQLLGRLAPADATYGPGGAAGERRTGRLVHRSA